MKLRLFVIVIGVFFYLFFSILLLIDYYNSFITECGTYVRENIKLESNLDCPYSDGLIVDSDDVVIDLNGYNITGPDIDRYAKTSSKVGIMIPHFSNTIIKGPGIIQGFQAAILAVSSSNVFIKNLTLIENQMGISNPSSRNFYSLNNEFSNNQIGVAVHSNQNFSQMYSEFTENSLAGITFVNAIRSFIINNSISESGNGIYIDRNSEDNIIAKNILKSNTVDLIDNSSKTNSHFINNICLKSIPLDLCKGLNKK